MDKAEAMNRILLLVEQVDHSGPWKGRAKLKMELNSFYKMVDRYKHDAVFNKSCVQGAQRVFDQARERFNEGH